MYLFIKTVLAMRSQCKPTCNQCCYLLKVNMFYFSYKYKIDIYTSTNNGEFSRISH